MSTKRSGIMLCYPYEEKRLSKWGTSFFIAQPKLDGERCRAIVYPNHEVVLLSSEENEIISVPHINEELSELSKELSFSGEFDGELYTHGVEFSSLHSRIGRTVNLHEDSDEIEYHIFDLVSNHEQARRLFTLNNLLANQDHEKVKLVKFDLVHNAEEVFSTLETYLDENYEGIIIRNPLAPYERKRSTNIMKFKPRKSDIYLVTNYEQLVDKNGNFRDELGALVCTSDEGTKFNIGSGFTSFQRKAFWQMRDSLIGKFVRVNYQAITPKKVPRFPIFVELIDPDFKTLTL